MKNLLTTSLIARTMLPIVALMLSGCLALNPSYQSDSTTPVKPKWEPLVEGSEIKADVNYKYHPNE